MKCALSFNVCKLFQRARSVRSFLSFRMASLDQDAFLAFKSLYIFI